MKIRYKPTTNSSTCSYVMVGYKINVIPPKEWFVTYLCKKLFPDEVEGMTDENIHSQFYELCYQNSKGIQIFTNTDEGTPNNDTFFIGRVVTESDDTGMFNGNDIVDFDKILKEIKWIEDKIDINNKLKLIIGSRMC